MGSSRSALIAMLVAISIGVGTILVGSQGGASFRGVPVFAIAVGLAFVIQWIAFIPAYLLQTERFFDLTGSLSYILVTAVAVALSPARDMRAILLLSLVVIWAARLGTFLFRRVQKAGKDDRFDDIKPSFLRFLNTWTIQGLWVSLTLAAALAAITSVVPVASSSVAWVPGGLDAYALAGLAIWIAGFTFEAVADVQKSRFRADPLNKGTFIRTGLWSWSRHPNYFGEIVLWSGVALIAFPVLAGWQLATLISPVFVFVLLTRVSGVPLLEKKADDRWGGQPDYEAYKAQTSVLVPLPPRA